MVIYIFCKKFVIMSSVFCFEKNIIFHSCWNDYIPVIIEGA